MFMATPEPFKTGCLLKITLLYSPAPRQVRQWVIEVAPNSTVIQAILACSIFKEFPELAENQLIAGIWGQKTPLDRLLENNDRIEIYRSLRVDPKIARRERFDRQGTKSAGLFRQKRPGAKSGY